MTKSDNKIILSGANASLNAFIESAFPLTQSLQALPGDASTRKYYRGQTPNMNFMVMDSSAEKDAYFAFVKMTDFLLEAEQPVPEIYARHEPNGYLLIEDFGSLDFADVAYANPEKWLPKALAQLANWQQSTQKAQPLVLEYEVFKVRDELSRLTEWFIPKFFKNIDQIKLSKDLDTLTNLFIQAPKRLVHRDYHSRNIMIKANGNLGLIDYQDAIWGNIVYDVISLTRDCYFRYDDKLRAKLETQFAENMTGVSAKDFEVASLQRHIKVLGLFIRLAFRDGKKRYLYDLPRVWQYAIEETQKLSDEVPYLAEIFSENQALIADKLEELANS